MKIIAKTTTVFLVLTLLIMGVCLIGILPGSADQTTIIDERAYNSSEWNPSMGNLTPLTPRDGLNPVIILDENYDSFLNIGTQNLEFTYPLFTAPKDLEEGEYYEITMMIAWEPGYKGSGGDLNFANAKKENWGRDLYIYGNGLVRTATVDYYASDVTCKMGETVYLTGFEDSRGYGAGDTSYLKIGRIRVALFTYEGGEASASEESLEESLEESELFEEISITPEISEEISECESTASEEESIIEFSYDESSEMSAEPSFEASEILVSEISESSCIDVSYEESEHSEESETRYLLGDVLEDGVIDMKDVLALRQFIAGMDVKNLNENLEALDCRPDRFIDLKDVLFLRRSLAQII